MGLDIPTPAQPEKGAETDELSDELSDAELDEQPGEALDAELLDPDEESDAEMTLRSAAEAMRDLFDQLALGDLIGDFGNHQLPLAAAQTFNPGRLVFFLVGFGRFENPAQTQRSPARLIRF